jgi:hypothetical protein
MVLPVWKAVLRKADNHLLLKYLPRNDNLPQKHLPKMDKLRLKLLHKMATLKPVPLSRDATWASVFTRATRTT